MIALAQVGYARGPDAARWTLRSVRFLGLSGAAGVVVGLVALVSAPPISPRVEALGSAFGLTVLLGIVLAGLVMLRRMPSGTPQRREVRGIAVAWTVVGALSVALADHVWWSFAINVLIAVASIAVLLTAHAERLRLASPGRPRLRRRG